MEACATQEREQSSNNSPHSIVKKRLLRLRAMGDVGLRRHRSRAYRTPSLGGGACSPG